MGRALVTLKNAVAEEPAQATVVLALRCWLLMECMHYVHWHMHVHPAHGEGPVCRMYTLALEEVHA